MTVARTAVTRRQHAPVTERKYLLPLTLITSLFFLWALGVNLNDVLIPHLKKAFLLSDFQSSLVQSAFFGGYFIAALPAGWLMERIGYKRGLLVGLVTCATGAVLFYPAASVRLYGFFLFALFVMASGQSFLEVGANPYVTILGPAESSARRLNIAQSFNAVGAVLTPIIGAAFILTNTDYTKSQLSAMTAGQLESLRLAEANTVKIPYLVIALVFLLVALLIYVTDLPEIRDQQSGREITKLNRGLSWTLAYPHLVRGVIAQFFYCGAQVGVGSFVIRFVQHLIPGIPSVSAANYLKLHLFGFMLGRFSGSAIMKYVPAPRLLSIFAAGGFLCVVVALVTSTMAAIWAVVLAGFFNSIMFPTIFALSLKNLGPYTKRASSLLVMSIVGSATLPAVMGLISDRTSIQTSFVVPLICYAVVFYFGVAGYRPGDVKSAETPVVAGAEAQ
ncbi:MAG TPA: L-fucose:H+ symporter permease [Terriglobales bacterium]|nr:L-fucose:H+ symporter permease [Terriglobales bacterium]